MEEARRSAWDQRTRRQEQHAPHRRADRDARFWEATLPSTYHGIVRSVAHLPEREVTQSGSSIRHEKFGRWRLVADLQERLEHIGREHGVGASFADRRRRLQLGHYRGLFLFGLLNPAVRTMRGLCAATHLPRLQSEVCGRPVSLGSFSEAQAVVDLGCWKEFLQN